MEIVLQGLVGLSCLFLVGLGARTMFAPKSMVEILAVVPEGSTGLNTIRGFLGGLFIGSSIVLASGLATGNTTFLLAVATVMGVVVASQAVSEMSHHGPAGHLVTSVSCVRITPMCASILWGHATSLLLRRLSGK